MSVMSTMHSQIGCQPTSFTTDSSAGMIAGSNSSLSCSLQARSCMAWQVCICKKEYQAARNSQQAWQISGLMDTVAYVRTDCGHTYVHHRTNVVTRHIIAFCAQGSCRMQMRQVRHDSSQGPAAYLFWQFDDDILCFRHQDGELSLERKPILMWSIIGLADSEST